MKTAFFLAICLVSVWLSNAGGLASLAPQAQREEFTAEGKMPSVSGSDMVGAGASANFSIYVDSYSSDLEARAMASEFALGGYKALRKALDKAPLKGRITMAGRDGSYELKLIRSQPTENGRRIFAVGGRAIRFLDAYYSGRSHDYHFGVLQLELKSNDGREPGSGVLFHRARITKLEADTIALEDFGIEPARLTNVLKQ
jgi:hypothetical protein